MSLREQRSKLSAVDNRTGAMVLRERFSSQVHVAGLLHSELFGRALECSRLALNAGP